MITKDLDFDIKSISEDGTFEGWLTAYDVTDLGGDVMRFGALTKTIQEKGGTFPLLWQHNTNEPIGIFDAEERPEGIWIKGKLLLAVQRAREAYELIKAGVIRGLSIGYKAIKSKMIEGVRNLFEIKLFEGSIVTFPMLPDAQIQSVKNGISAETIEEFRIQYLAFAPKLFTLSAEDVKAGRRHSAATLAAIDEAISKLQALRGQETESTSEEAAPLATIAADNGIEPEAIHSLLGLGNDLVSAIRAN